MSVEKGGVEGGMEGGVEGGKDGGREVWREGGMEGGRWYTNLTTFSQCAKMLKISSPTVP